MSYFDDASLVMIPSGYKNQKVYSVKPLDGSGDLTFSRASSATRVASNGYIEKVRTNLLTYSNTFSNAAWTKNNVTLTAGQVDPNGGTNGTRAQFSGVSYIFQAPSTAFATASVYVRATSGTANIRIGDSNGNYVVAYALTESWQRITAFGSAMSGISIDSFIGGSWTAQDVIIAFAQFETGDIATDYIATTSAAVSVGPVSGLPRLDYLNSTCPRLLLEPQRSSLVTYSEQINNAAWTKRNSTISANAATSPDGYTNADKIQEDTSNDRHDIYQSFSVTSGTAYTISGFVKAAERTFCFLSFGSSNVNGGNAFFNLSTGTVVSSPAGITSTITSYGNGWYRITSSGTASGTGSAYVVCGPTLTGTSITYQGVSGSGIMTYGFMAEAGAYATSYIPTFGTSVTRVKDVALTGSVPSLIGQTEGVMFIDFNRLGTLDDSLFILSNVAGTASNSYGNSVYIYQISNGNLVVECYISFVQQFSFSLTALSVGRHKVAIAYKQNDFAIYVDGVLRGTDTSGNVPAMNYLTIAGGADVPVQIQAVNQALLFKTRLTNAQLAELTTL